MNTKLPLESFVPGGKPVELVDYYEKLRWYYPDSEPETKHWFVKNIQPGWQIFDVGANVGIYSTLFSRLASQGHVIAFEPTETVEMLRKNLDHNQCSNVQVEEIALGSKTGAIEDGIFRIWGDEPERKIYPFYRIDDYVQNNLITRLDCIKIDVDSFDFEVLLGASETIRNLRPAIVVNLNHALSRRNQSNIKALEWIRSQGIEEVLSLDGDNFALLPKGDVKASYPVGSSLKISFADTNVLPSPDDEGKIRVLQTLDPHHTGVVHGRTQVSVLPGGSQIEVLTQEGQWAFSISFPVQLDLPSDPTLRVMLDVEVISGRVGVGCMERDWQFIGPERQIGPGARRALLLPITDPAHLSSVMVRNVREDGKRSTFRVFGVKIGQLIDEDVEPTCLTSEQLARRVFEAVSSEGDSEGFTPPVSQGVIDVVEYGFLHDVLGFAEAYVPPEGAARQPLAFWKMERDDAPIFQYVYRNLRPARHLEFGTWEGFGVVACAESCDAEIWTLNLPDGELTAGGNALYQSVAPGGAAQTDAGAFIGRLYRDAGYSDRVHQILVDSTHWEPDMPEGFFDTALIDGGHTDDVVTSDTDKAIALVRSGGIVMWHDFCPEEEALQAHRAPRGVVSALAYNHHRWAPYFSKLFWIKPSWVLVGVRR